MRMKTEKKIEETVKSWNMPTTVFVFLVLFLVFFSSLAYLLIYAKSGNIPYAAGSAFLTWISYSGIHRLMVGVPIDARSREKEMPSTDDEWVLFGIASFLFIGGMSLVALGLNSGTEIETMIGVGVVLTGYFIAHYDLEDDIV
jgi:hypothetical protein